MTEIRSVLVVVDGKVTGLQRSFRDAGRESDKLANSIEGVTSRSDALTAAQQRFGRITSSNQAIMRGYNAEMRAHNSILTRQAPRLSALAAASNRIETGTRRASAGVRILSRDTSTLEQRARAAERSSSLLTDSIVGLGPGALAAAAVASPALVGITAQLGVGVAAAGGLLLAFNGVGDAIGALNDYNLDPTVDNFIKAQTALSTLPTQAQAFVRELDGLRPVIKDLRSDAAGVFPGISAGLDDLLTRLPQVRTFMQTVAATTGNLLADAGEGLAGPEFDAFFDYLNRTASPTLTGLGRTVGNLSKSFANFLVATAPLQSDFTRWLEGSTRALADFTAGLNGSEGLNDFIDYVRDNGPKVAAALGDIGSAVVQLVQAAAPLGGPTLQILSLLAKVIGEIADSPVGTPLIALASGLALANRAIATRDLAANSPIGQLLSGRSSGLDRSRNKITGLGASLRQTRTDIGTIGTTWATAGARSERESARVAAASGRVRVSLANVGKGAAVIGAVGLASTGLSDKIGLANTTSLALAGTLAGPMGAAAGAATGLFLDLRASTEDVDDALQNVNRTSKSTDLSTLADSIKRADDAIAKSNTFGNRLVRSTISSLPGGGVFDFFNKAPDTSGVDRNEKRLERLKAAYRDLAKTVGTPLPAGASLDQIEDFAARAQPALEAAGVSIDRLAAGSPSELNKARDALRAFGIELDGVSDRARQTAIALQNLSPKVDLSAARDELTKTIRSLDDLTRAGVDPSKTSKGAIANRDLVRSAVVDTQALVQAQANAGRGADVMAGTVAKSRKAIIDAGVAAGISRPEIVKYVNSLGLTPALVQTIIRANVEEAQGKVRTFLRGLSLTPSEVKTVMSLATQPAKLNAYLTRLGATPAQKKTIMAALTAAANGNISALLKLLNDYGRKNPKAKLGVRNFASGVIAAVSAALSALNGKTAITRIVTQRVTKGQGTSYGGGIDTSGSAYGNIFDGQGRRTFAQGGMWNDALWRDPDDRRNAHQPKMYGPGTARVFREPETQGEGYIPLADDARRPRAKAITQEIVHRFGGHVTWNAYGSLTPGKDDADYKVALLQAGSEVQQIKNELAAKRKNARGQTVSALTPYMQGVKKAQLAAAQFNLEEIKRQHAAEAAAPGLALSGLASFGSGGSSSIFTRGASASGALSTVNRLIADVSAYGQTMAALRAAKASPALLAQVVAQAESGDIRSAVRLGKSLLAQPALLGSLNSALAELGQVSSSVAAYTGSAQFTSGRGTLAAPVVRQYATVNVPIDPTADPTLWKADLARTAAHQVSAVFDSGLGGLS